MADDPDDKDQQQQDGQDGGEKKDADQPPKPHAKWPWIVAGLVVVVFVAVILILVWCRIAT